MQVCSQQVPRISTNAVDKWTKANAGHPKFKAIADLIEQVERDLVEKLELNHPGFALPERLTKDRYMRIYKKIFATLRYDFF